MPQKFQIFQIPCILGFLVAVACATEPIFWGVGIDWPVFKKNVGFLFFVVGFYYIVHYYVALLHYYYITLIYGFFSEVKPFPMGWYPKRAGWR